MDLVVVRVFGLLLVADAHMGNCVVELVSKGAETTNTIGKIGANGRAWQNTGNWVVKLVSKGAETTNMTGKTGANGRARTSFDQRERESVTHILQWILMGSVQLLI